ncbi:MAG: hypothetical protein M3Q42_07295 [Pseudomonadota bacterium]|nr:hypothetical protein [Pseudomonadota bacterium]
MHTATGDAVAHKVFERNTQRQPVDYISTDQAAYPGTSEPKRYEDIARTITPGAAAAALGSAPLSAAESMAARRAATTARALADVSEQQRNGAGKHARAAMRSVARDALPAQDVYAGQTPAFPQAKGPGGMQYHRDVMAGGTLTAGFKTVVDNFSDSSDDEQVAALSPRDAIQRYRMRTETAAVRNTFGAGAGAGVGAGAAAASAAAGIPGAMEASPAPRRSGAMHAQAGAEDRADAFPASSARAAGGAAAPAAAFSSTQARTDRAEARARQRAESFADRFAAPAPAPAPAAAAAAGADVDMEPVGPPREKRPRSAGSSVSGAKRQQPR